MWPAILNAALERTKIEEEEGVKRTTSSMDKDFFVAKASESRMNWRVSVKRSLSREMTIRPAHGMIACRSRWVGDGILFLSRPREHYA
jgi:hypothetical protein